MLEQGSANLLCEGPDGKYFGLSGLYDPHQHHLTVLLEHKSSPKQCHGTPCGTTTLGSSVGFIDCGTIDPLVQKLLCCGLSYVCM